MNRESMLSMPISEFLSITSLDSFTGRLHENTKQFDAWQAEFQILQTALKGYEGTIIFEYGIPGVKKVVDTILLIGQTIFVVEFKVGAEGVQSAFLDQTMGYALRLKYFHSESNTRQIVPILVTTKSPTDMTLATEKLDTENVYYPSCCNGKGLRDAIGSFYKGNYNGDISWQVTWQKGIYNPSPSIIEAVIAAWDEQNVSGLSESDIDDIGKANHLKAETEILNIIEESKRKGRKSIVFVTGVPGAGKTLVGLNTSVRAQRYGASMLSGNGPLVEVLTEALWRNIKIHKKSDEKKAKRDYKLLKKEIAIESIIRHVYTYKNEIIDRMDYSCEPYKLQKDATKSAQHVIIYDEAQRAWSRDKMIKHTSRSGKKEWQKTGWKFSEPEILMWDLAQLDWGVMVCLIGGGQEINNGEAGISEWLRALYENTMFSDWDIYMASELTSAEYNTTRMDGMTICDVCGKLQNHYIGYKPELHLKECQRTTRAKGLSEFINLLVAGNATNSDYNKIRPYYRIYLTRDLEKAKSHLRHRKKELTPIRMEDGIQESEIRAGVLMSSRAKRMRPLGYEIKKDSDYRNKTPDWFLDIEQDSIDSSDRLEVALSEFLVQGLELDLSLVLWDADFRYDAIHREWHFYSCGKNSWGEVSDVTTKFYMRNAYRVLLTRARSEMVIFLPKGSSDDPTRDASFYDQTYNYLSGLGLNIID